MAAETTPQVRMSAEGRRQQLINIAIDLFSQKGFAGTTTKEIATAAGVTEAIIFRHFATKRDLYTAILDTIKAKSNLDQWQAESQRLMDACDDQGLIRLLVSKVIASIRTEPRFERLMILAALEGNELAELHMQQYAIPIAERIIEYLGQRQADGALAPGRPDAMLLTIVGAAQLHALHEYVYTQSIRVNCNSKPANANIVEDLTYFLSQGILNPKAKEQRK